MAPQVAEAAAVRAGEAQTGGSRYVVVLVEEVRPAALQSLSEVSPRIRNLLLQGRVEELKRQVVERIVRGGQEDR